MLRLHGDCHAGNILWTDEGPHFVDLDDARMGPAVQDLWMWLAGDRETSDRYGVAAIPHTVVIDRAGYVRQVYRGGTKDLERQVASLLK